MDRYSIACFKRYEIACKGLRSTDRERPTNAMKKSSSFLACKHFPFLANEFLEYIWIFCKWTATRANSRQRMERKWQLNFFLWAMELIIKVWTEHKSKKGFRLWSLSIVIPWVVVTPILVWGVRGLVLEDAWLDFILYSLLDHYESFEVR